MGHMSIFSSLVCLRKAAEEANLDALADQLDIAILIAAAAIDKPSHPAFTSHPC